MESLAEQAPWALPRFGLLDDTPWSLRVEGRVVFDGTETSGTVGEEGECGVLDPEEDVVARGAVSTVKGYLTGASVSESGIADGVDGLPRDLPSEDWLAVFCLDLVLNSSVPLLSARNVLS